MLHVTAVFSQSEDPSLTLESVELYADTRDGLQPRIPLANGAFNSTGAPIDTTGGGGTTQFRFNATTNGGIALAHGTSYWLVLAFVDGSYRALQGSTVPYDGAAIGGLVGLGGRVVVEPQQGGWADSNEVVALSIDIFGCLQPSPSPTPTRSPSSSPSTSPSRSPSPTSIDGQVKAIVNTTATFSDEVPAVSITGSLPESSSAVAVELGVAGLLLGDVAVDFEALNTTRMQWTIIDHRLRLQHPDRSLNTHTVLLPLPPSHAHVVRWTELHRPRRYGQVDPQFHRRCGRHHQSQPHLQRATQRLHDSLSSVGPLHAPISDCRAADLQAGRHAASWHNDLLRRAPQDVRRLSR